MFKYNYVADLIDRLVKNVDYPMQVEFHPGPDCGFIHCRYCYGKLQKANDGLLSIENYTKLLDDLQGRTNLIDISGITTDPISYPYFYELIELLKQRNIHFGIHTKGFKLNQKLSRLLNSGMTDGNFITLSIDSASSEVYNLLHGVKKGEEVFEYVKEQIKVLKNEKETLNSKLRINMGYLLFKENSKEEHIQEFINTFEPYADVLRFSIPQVPNQAKPIGYLSEEEIPPVIAMLKKYERKNIVVLKFDYSAHDKSFNTCWSQRFNITIDKAGNVYPCPQVATSVYNHICYGNIKEQNIWEIWSSNIRNRILKMDVDKEMKCRVCDRKDENINIELEKILNPNKYI